VGDRAVLTGILFVVLRTGIAWELLPVEIRTVSD
jgi:hypothetical protein